MSQRLFFRWHFSMQDRQAATVSELKGFVKRMGALPEVTRHTALAGEIAAATRPER